MREMFMTGLVDNVAHEDGATLLGVPTHRLRDSLAHAVREGAS